MVRRTTPSLTFSEYVSPDPNHSVEVWQARLRLIEAAKRVYPIFLRKLSSDVFPLYSRLASSPKGEMTLRRRCGGSFPMPPSPKTEGSSPHLRNGPQTSMLRRSG